MSRSLARRSHRSIRRRNPMGKVHWSLLATGAIVGGATGAGAAYAINATANPPKTTTTEVALKDAGFGAAVGFAFAGVAGALMMHSGSTAIAGLAAGGLLFAGLYYMPATATTPTTPAATTA